MSNLKKEIKDLLFEYAAIPSFTHSRAEKLVEAFFEGWFNRQDYFREHKDYWGLYPVIDDHLERSLAWGMVKGEGDQTVVMIHHYDVVEVEEYESVKSDAFNFNLINERLQEMLHKFDSEAIRDLESGQWQFGRGSADMKAGGSIQMTLLKKAALDGDFKGNLILLAVPDEESLSDGMRSAIPLLVELQKQYKLDYKLMINSEPHQRFSDDEGVLYEGSIGKMMPLVYVRGSLAHVGRIYEGFNPLPLMAEIVARSDLNFSMSDQVDDEVSPPPCWMYLKDRKTQYDVSIPTAIAGYLSVLNLKSSPEKIINQLRKIAESAFDDVIKRMDESYRAYRKALNKETQRLPWKTNVRTFEELILQAEIDGGENFKLEYQNQLKHLKEKIQFGTKDMLTATFDLIEMTLEFLKDKSPTVIIGLSPPYYPNVTNELMPGVEPKILELPEKISTYTFENWNQEYITRKYFTGISDLSYATFNGNQGLTDLIEGNMPLWGEVYRIPFEDIEKISMPAINIGPWGKDFHRITERVLKEDLYDRTPELIGFTIKTVLNGD